jgi:hypothetical protein
MLWIGGFCISYYSAMVCASPVFEGVLMTNSITNVITLNTSVTTTLITVDIITK